MDSPRIQSGRLHEREITPLPVPDHPFANRRSPDLHPITLDRTFLVDRLRYRPRLATRTPYSNFLTYSEDFSNVAWTKPEVTITAAQRANPWDGQFTFSKILEKATTAQHDLVRSSYAFIALPHVVQAYVAPELGRSFVRLDATDGVTTFSGVFDIVSGVVFGTPANCTARIRRYTDGACKVMIFFTPIAAGGQVALILSTDGTTISYLGDITKGVYCAGLQVDRASSEVPYVATTTATRTSAVPDVDGIVNAASAFSDDFSYLVAESKLEPIDMLRARVNRRYARIPADQVRYDTRAFPRPPLHDLALAGGLGTVWAVSFDDLETTTLFFERLSSGLALSTPDIPTTSNPAHSATQAALPGGITISLTGAGGSSSFDTGDSVATIDAALDTAIAANSWKVVRDAYSIRFKVTASLFTVSTGDSRVRIEGSPPGTGAGVYEEIVIAVADSNAASTRTLTATGNGGAVGDKAVLWNGNKIVAMAPVVAAATDSFTVELAEVPGRDFAVTAYQFAKNGLRLVNGTKDCTIKITEKFYAPGVTPGISTEADIPSVPLYDDPVGWFGRILATTHTACTATASSDLLTKTAHGLSTGDTFFLLAKTNAAGLSLLTQYWAIRISADTFCAATSSENAAAGSYVDITSDGTSITVLVPAPYAAIASGKLEDYHGFIVSKAREEVQLADALQTRSATA
jgi:hypothetical protein